MNENWRKEVEKSVSLESMVGVGCAVLFLAGMAFYACSKPIYTHTSDNHKITYHTNYWGVVERR